MCTESIKGLESPLQNFQRSKYVQSQAEVMRLHYRTSRSENVCRGNHRLRVSFIELPEIKMCTESIRG